MTSQKSPPNFVLLLMLVSISIIVVYIILYFLLINASPVKQMGELSTLISSVFAALAFGAVIVTIYQQQKTIELQIEELRQSVDEQRKATIEFKNQNKNIELQRFESIFFQLLQNHFSVSQSLRVKFGNDYVVGNEVFVEIWTRVHSDFVSKLKFDTRVKKANIDIDEKLKILKEKFFNVYKLDVSDKLNIYFRSLTYALDFINSSVEINEDTKLKLKTLLRFHIHDYAVYLIGLHSILARDNIILHYRMIVKELNLDLYFYEKSNELKMLIYNEIIKFSSNE